MTKVAAVAAGTCCLILSLPAQALNNRTWVSGTGTDNASCGPIASPCRTLQYAHDQTSSGGVIDVKDSAGYGALNITKAISIVANGVMAGALAGASGTAINVSAGANDRVFLQGLTVEGVDFANRGISFNSGRSLSVSQCVIRGFDSGIYISPASGAPTVSINDTTLSNNLFGGGLNYNSGTAAQTKIIMNRVIVDNNYWGIALGVHGGSLNMQINNSVISNSGASGITTGYDIFPGTVVIDDTHIFNNSKGIDATSLLFLLRRSVISANSTGVHITGSATFYSYRDNSINGNGTDVQGPGTMQSAPLQ